jgi:hypothetical protein
MPEVRNIIPAQAGIQGFPHQSEFRLAPGWRLARFLYVSDMLSCGVALSGQGKDGLIQIVNDFGKLRNAHHVEYLFKMTGKTRDGNGLAVSFCLGQKLNQERYPSAVDVGIGIELQQNLVAALIAHPGVSILQERFREDRHIPMDMNENDPVPHFQHDFILLLHGQPALKRCPKRLSRPSRSDLIDQGKTLFPHALLR